MTVLKVILHLLQKDKFIAMEFRCVTHPLDRKHSSVILIITTCMIMDEERKTSMEGKKKTEHANFLLCGNHNAEYKYLNLAK